MSHKKTYKEKREIRNENKPNKKERGNVKDIAGCLMTAILEKYISYHQFKEIQAIIDAKFDKPCWAITKKLS
jgi:hypothetical protein